MRRPSAICAIAVMLILVACTRTVATGDILADPGRYYGQTVKVSGRVSAGLGAAGFNVYRLTEGGEELWVVSYKDHAPTDGESVIVTGRVNEAVTISGVPLPTHLVEDSREVAK